MRNNIKMYLRTFLGKWLSAILLRNLKMITFLYHLRTFIIYFSVLTILPLCWLPMFIYKIFVSFIVKLTKPNFGKTINCVDVILEEESLKKEGNVPKSSIVNSVTLNGSFTIEELRKLFQQNVLDKWRIPSRENNDTTTTTNNNNNNNNGEMRYPELKQYPTSFMGYTFWKTDEKFRLEDHIVEDIYEKDEQPSLSLIHQAMLNRSFIPNTSPWEMVLINNYRSDIDDNNCLSKKKALIITRFHHSMADARSILKLFVECLGEHPLKTAEPQTTKSVSILDILMVPINFVCILFEVLHKTAIFWVHPWKTLKTQRALNDSTPQIVRVSSKLSLAQIKDIGKKTEGTAASVILAIISGAVARLKPNIGQLFAVYILPKDNHPETLGNHAGFGALTLPSNEDSPSERLTKCHQVFKKLKGYNMGKYLEVPLSVLATLFNPWRGIFVREIMSTSPIGITNIAGERDGFSIGQRNCEEFIFSVGTLLGDTGVVFCISSYRSHLRIVVVSAGGILNENEVDELASNMRKELETLNKLISI